MKLLRTGAMILCALVLILDSRCAVEAARDALELCCATLIPSLFPLFVLSSMLVPELGRLRIPQLSRLLGFPSGSEGIFALGCAGGFPVGAACIAQAVRDGSIGKRDARRMLGLSSFCGPSFLFGVIPSVLSISDVGMLFLIQLETALLTAALWPGVSMENCRSGTRTVTLTAAVRQAIGSMTSVCAWVMLAAVAVGFLRRWLFPLLSEGAAVFLTGLLELTNGVFALPNLPGDLRFVLCAVFISFGGVSVLLQIQGLASAEGIPMGTCVLQKGVQALLAAVIAVMYRKFGMIALILPVLPLIVKFAVAIPGQMVYNVPRKEGI